MIEVRVQQAGLQTWIQDLGRSGHQAFGVPSGGALDRTAARTANWLVGNPENTPVLELTLRGPKLQLTAPCQIALTGANLSPQCNGQPIAMHQTINLVAGSVLSFGRCVSACRAYLAIGGNWNVKRWLGSASVTTNLDVLPQNRLQKGTILSITPKTFISTRTSHAPTLSNSITSIRVLAGPEFEYFPRQTIAAFFGRVHRISVAANRMGCRLEGQIPMPTQKTSLISSGIVPGTIQVTNEGQSILLLADAQTTGGYWRIANVIDTDLDQLAQLKPGDSLQFLLADYGLVLPT